jgi:beta-lactamase regulating signal transducer with metallopeptidase domain
MMVPLPLSDIAGLLALLLRATLLLCAAWAAAAALRKAGASAAARHMAWLLGIAALLALPVLACLVPALHLPILPAEAATAAGAAAPSPFLPTEPISTDVPIHPSWNLVLLAVYVLGTAALLLRLIVGRRMLKRLWSEADTVRDPAWQALLSRLSSEMQLSRRVDLRIAQGPAVPMTWGTLAPRLLLPAEASEWPLERRRLVLLHELAHVARRDSLSRSLASLACALYWFHPGAWLAARQLRLEQEHAADDRVLIAGGSAQAYALSLLHLARGMRAGPRFDQAAAMAGMYQLERRLVSITSPARRDRPGTFFLSSSALCAALATLVVAAGVPVSASTTPISLEHAQRGDFAVRLAKGLDLVRSVDRSAKQGRGERSGSKSVISEAVAQAPALDAARIAEQGPAPGVAGSSERGESSPAEEASQDRRQSPAYADQLPDYGWQLPKRDSRVAIGSPAASSPNARLILPAPLVTASSERTDRPSWARITPRLVAGSTTTRSSAPTSQRTLMLSVSVDVGAQ